MSEEDTPKSIDILNEKLCLFKNQVSKECKISIEEVSAVPITYLENVIARIYFYHPQTEYTIIYFPATAFCYSSMNEGDTYFPYNDAVARMLALVLRCYVAVIYTSVDRMSVDHIDTEECSAPFSMQVEEAKRNFKLLFEGELVSEKCHFLLPTNVFIYGYCSGAVLGTKVLFDMLTTNEREKKLVKFLGFALGAPCFWYPDCTANNFELYDPKKDDSLYQEDPSTDSKFIFSLARFLLKPAQAEWKLFIDGLPDVFKKIRDNNITVFIASGEKDIFKKALQRYLLSVVEELPPSSCYVPENGDHGSHWFNNEYLHFIRKFFFETYATFLYNDVRSTTASPSSEVDNDKKK